MIFWNSVKSDNEMLIEIRDFDSFWKKTRRWIHRIKNHSIWIKIRGEILNEQERNFRKIKLQKTEIEIQIHLNYNSKLTSKAIQRNIRMKHNP